jgi:Putative adhesin
MVERCSTCGAELFAGQQFCRRCGRAVAARAGEDAPTQILQQGAQAGGAGVATDTSPLGRGARTDAVGPRQPIASQQPLGSQPPASFQPTAPLVGQPFGSRPLAVGQPAQGRGRRGAWLVALLVVALLCVGVAGGAGMMWWHARQRALAARMAGAGEVRVPNVPNVPPPLPPDFGERLSQQIKDSIKNAGTPLDESGATVTGADTVVTKSFELDDDATFALRGVSGDVTVTGTDGDRAEVKITKHGGSPAERGSAPVLFSQTDKGVSLVGAGGPPGVKLSYEVKLPRDLHQLEISTENGNVRVEGFGGSVAVNVQKGDLEFRDVTGAVHSKQLNGSTRLFVGGDDRDAAQEFSVVNGGIEATVADGADADLKAETVNGDIAVDEHYGLKVERRPAGRALAGQLGDGGQPLSLKAVNGDIKLKK